MANAEAWSKLAKKYPWPEKRPVDRDLTGWHTKDRKDFLRKHLPNRNGILLELGVWKGLSTDWFLKAFKGLDVVCIDHWKGSEEHHRMDVKKDLPHLYNIFLGNMYLYRQRIIPLRADTLSGMKEVHAAGMAPDVIYIDAAHDYESVKADVNTAIELFPKAMLFGDDWDFPDVNKAVKEVAVKHGRSLRGGKRTWQIIK
jgi:hypothetical protein